jgi:hypothetical protein
MIYRAFIWSYEAWMETVDSNELFNAVSLASVCNDGYWN